MPEISIRQKRADWACRMLITIDVFVIVSGYLSFSQARRQLISPLIPETTVYRILMDQHDMTSKISLVLAGLFATGLWFYSFNRKIPAIIFFCLTIMLYPLLPRLF